MKSRNRPHRDEGLLKRPVDDERRGSEPKRSDPPLWVIGISLFSFLVAAVVLTLISFPEPRTPRDPAAAGIRSLPAVPGIQPSVLAAGRDIYMREGCYECHQLQGTDPENETDTDSNPDTPDLTHEGRRHASIAWQVMNLTHHETLFPNSSMGNYSSLTPHELRALATFLTTRK